MAAINWTKKEELLERDKKFKINTLKNDCTLSIYEGFHSPSTGYDFGCNEHDQTNFNRQMLLILSGDNSDVEVKTKSHGKVILTAEQFKTVNLESKNHILQEQSKFWDLEKKVMDATTQEEVNLIKWYF